MYAEIEALVGEWLSLAEAAERLGCSVPQVRSLVRSGQLLAVRRGDPPQPFVPAAFVADGHLVRKLPGTLSLLRDQGYTDLEALRWLFTPDDSLPGTPAEALRADRGTEVRRRAQALAF